jgi:hypothetical protein
MFQERVASEKARLAHQQEIHASVAHLHGVPPPPTTIDVADAPIVTTPTPMPDLPPPPIPDPDAIVPDTEDVGFPHFIANLIIAEVASLSIHSDTRRNPLAAGYDLAIPPAMFDEAM